MAAKRNQAAAEPGADINQADYRSAAYLRMAPALEIMEDLRSTTLHIRVKGQKYLPKFPMEADAKYAIRLNTSVVYNVTQRTGNALVGMIFRTDPTPLHREETPDNFKQMFEDIDLCGNDLPTFLRETGENQIFDGHSFIFVDAPADDGTEDPVPSSGQTKKKTLRDVKDMRAYWVNYTADQMISWRTETVKGKEILTQVVFEVKTLEPTGNFGEQEVTRYRQFNRGSFTYWKRQLKTNSTNEYEIVVEKQGTIPWCPDMIPISVAYGKKTGTCESIPPLLELALLNILHYQKTSDYDSICHEVCVPLLVDHRDQKEDFDKDKQPTPISGSVKLNSWGQFAEIYRVGTPADGMEMAENRILQLENQMASLGIQQMAPGDAVERTAFEVGVDDNQSSSDLAVMAHSLENCVKGAMYFTALHDAHKRKTKIDETQLSTLGLQIDYKSLTISPEMLTFLSNLVDTNKLSLETFLEVLPTLAVMPKDFDPEEEMQKIEAQAARRQVQAIEIMQQTPPAPEPGKPKPPIPAPLPPKSPIAGRKTSPRSPVRKQK